MSFQLNFVGPSKVDLKTSIFKSVVFAYLKKMFKNEY